MHSEIPEQNLQGQKDQPKNRAVSGQRVTYINLREGNSDLSESEQIESIQRTMSSVINSKLGGRFHKWN